MPSPPPPPQSPPFCLHIVFLYLRLLSLVHILSSHLHPLHCGSELAVHPALPSLPCLCCDPLPWWPQHFSYPSYCLSLPFPPRLMPPFYHLLPLPIPHLTRRLVTACVSPAFFAPRRGSPSLCRTQDPHTVGYSRRPSLPDPPPPSLQVWRWHIGASPLSLWGAPPDAYPVQQGDMPSEHGKQPRRVGS